MEQRIQVASRCLTGAKRVIQSSAAVRHTRGNRTIAASTSTCAVAPASVAQGSRVCSRLAVARSLCAPS